MGTAIHSWRRDRVTVHCHVQVASCCCCKLRTCHMLHMLLQCLQFLTFLSLYSIIFAVSHCLASHPSANIHETCPIQTLNSIHLMPAENSCFDTFKRCQDVPSQEPTELLVEGIAPYLLDISLGKDPRSARLCVLWQVEAAVCRRTCLAQSNSAVPVASTGPNKIKA